MIIVSGGTGFVGSAVVHELLRRGSKVAVLGRDLAKTRSRFHGQAVDTRQGDVRDKDSLRAAFNGAETVVNAVQFPNSPIENKRKGWTFEQFDYQGTLNQLEAAKAAGVQRFIYISGVGAAPDAEEHWFRLKWQAEEAIRQSGIAHVIIRPTWVYGREDVALNRFVGFARRLPFVPMFGDGKQLMQPVFVNDLANLVASAVDKAEATGLTFEVGGPEVLSMNAVIEIALNVAGMRKPVLHQPVFVGKLLGSFLQFLPGPPLTRDAIDFITHEATADNSAMQRVFAPQLTTLEEGLSSYLSGRKALNVGE